MPTKVYSEFMATRMRAKQTSPNNTLRTKRITEISFITLNNLFYNFTILSHRLEICNRFSKAYKPFTTFQYIFRKHQKYNQANHKQISTQIRKRFSILKTLNLQRHQNPHQNPKSENDNKIDTNTQYGGGSHTFFTFDSRKPLSVRQQMLWNVIEIKERRTVESEAPSIEKPVERSAVGREAPSREIRRERDLVLSENRSFYRPPRKPKQKALIIIAHSQRDTCLLKTSPNTF